MRPSTSIGVSIASRVVPATLGDDHPLAAEERVDERGLADVRAPDHREPDDVLLGVGDLVVLGQQLDEAVEQVAGAEALGGGDRERLAEPEAVEVVRERRGRSGESILFAATTTGRLPRRRMSAISCVAGAHAGAGVDDEQRDLGVGQRGARLVLDRDRQRILVLEVHAAGVDQREAAPVPVGRELLAVARDAGALVHDRLARSA